MEISGVFSGANFKIVSNLIPVYSMPAIGEYEQIWANNLKFFARISDYLRYQTKFNCEKPVQHNGIVFKTNLIGNSEAGRKFHAIPIEFISGQIRLEIDSLALGSTS